MIRLPVPPSTNNLFANGRNGGRFKTREYKAWLEEAGLRLNLQRPAKIAGRFTLTIKVPRNVRPDVSNLIKAPEDLIVSHGIVRDDRLADKVSIERADVTEMELEVRAAA